MSNFELYKIPQGRIMIAFSDKNLSVGTLELNPKTELSKHNRPVLESLHQLNGKCVIQLFDKQDNSKEIILIKGESIDIEPEQFHIHSNPFNEKSTTFWKASGDISKIIEEIRTNRKM